MLSLLEHIVLWENAVSNLSSIIIVQHHLVILQVLDPYLYDMLNNGVRKYLGGPKQTPHDEHELANERNYDKLQQQ